MPIKQKIKVDKTRKGVKAKFIPRPAESPEVIEARWKKKKDRIHKLANDISRLRLNISKDLKLYDEDEKIFLTALIIAIMDRTAERIGNEESALDGHFGVSVFMRKHISINGKEITLKYKGKSGVDHEKTFKSEKIAKGLKWAMKNSKGKRVFETSQGQPIGADQVNRYLQNFDISSKNLRGFFVNKAITEKLQSIEIPKSERERKKIFNSVCKKVAGNVGHGASTCKKHYIVPELPEQYIRHGKIIDLKSQRYYKEGGEIEKSDEAKSDTMAVSHEEEYGYGGYIRQSDVDEIISQINESKAKGEPISWGNNYFTFTHRADGQMFRYNLHAEKNAYKIYNDVNEFARAIARFKNRGFENGGIIINDINIPSEIDALLKEQAILEKESDYYGNKLTTLSQIDSSPMGGASDKLRNTEGFMQLKKKFDESFKKLQDFNESENNKKIVNFIKKLNRMQSQKLRRHYKESYEKGGVILISAQKQIDEYIREDIFIRKGDKPVVGVLPISRFNGPNADIFPNQLSVDKEGVDKWRKRILTGERPYILIDYVDYLNENRVKDGHHRLKAYEQLAMDEIPVIDRNGKILNADKMAGGGSIDQDYKKWKRKNVTLRGMKEIGEENNAGAMLGRGLYTAHLSNKALSKEYGTVHFAVNARPKNPLKINTLNEWQIWFQNLAYRTLGFRNLTEFNKATTIEVEVQKLGYDGIEIIGREIVNFKPGDDVKYFRTEDELKDYYDSISRKENGGKVSIIKEREILATIGIIKYREALMEMSSIKQREFSIMSPIKIREIMTIKK